MKNFTEYGSAVLADGITHTTTFAPGDDVVDTMSGYGVTLLAHPHDRNMLILVDGHETLVINNNGRSIRSGATMIAKRPDIMIEARKKWDALTPDARRILNHAAKNGLIIASIKVLREMTGLGLTQAKRAIQEFSA